MVGRAADAGRLNAAEAHARAFEATLRRGAPPGRMPVHRWYLRHDRPHAIAAPPPRDDAALVTAHDCTVAFYRFLYEGVGTPWLWHDVRRMPDGAVAERLRSPGTHIEVLQLDGVPAGFVEARGEENATELAYVGLLPGFEGRGLGTWMLRAAIARHARAERPMTINTCTLDSPAGLALYVRLGFRVVGEIDFDDPDPRADGTVPPDVASHVPRF